MTEYPRSSAEITTAGANAQQARPERQAVDSEEYRHARECRLVATWPLARRTEYLLGVARHRGEAAARELAQGVAEVLKAKRAG